MIDVDPSIHVHLKILHTYQNEVVYDV